MIFRQYLGLDIRPCQLRAVALGRRGKSTVLVGGRILSLPEGTLRESLREPNVTDRRRLVEGIREVLHPISGREDRLALALPESAGRLLLVEVEAPFKSRKEGIEILKWQLKNSLPVEAKAVCLDYQVLEQREDGRLQVAVAVMAQPVLEQYEELVAEAGYHAALVDFHAPQLYNYYRRRLDLGGDSLLVGVDGGSLTLQYFQGNRLAYWRAREVGSEVGALFQEINRSLVGAQEQWPGIRRAGIFLHSDWTEREPLLDALGSLFEREVSDLDPHLQRLAQGSLDLPAGQVRSLVAAVGAAERLM